MSERYAVTELAKDLDGAIDAYEKALSLVSKGSSAEATVLANLSPALIRRAACNQDASDLELAVEMGRRSLSLTPEGSPETAARYNNLGVALRHRYERSGDPSDLDEAIKVHRLAVDRVGEFSPDRPGMLANLGDVLYIRFKRATQPADQDDAIKAWHMARQGLHATMIASVEAGRVSAQAAAITRHLLQAHLDRGSLAAALEDMEAGKAVGLRLALLRANHVPAGFNEGEEKESRSLIEELRAIDSGRRALGGIQLSDAERASRFAGLSHRQHKALTRVQALEARDPTFPVAPFRYSEMRGLAVGHDLTLAYLQPLDGATVAILIHAASPPDSPAPQDVLTLNGLTRPELRRLLLRLPTGLAWEEDRLRSLLAAVRAGEPLGWLRAYWLTQHPDLASSDHQDAEQWWRGTMDRVLEELRHHLIEPLARRLGDLKARRVVLIPDLLIYE